MNSSCAVIVLAAGKGTRMGGKTAKVLAESFRGPLLLEVLDSASTLSPEQISVVVGFEKERVETACASWAEERKGDFQTKLSFPVQEEQNGTGHAVRCALPSLSEFSGEVIILCGDVPLITSETLIQLLEAHREKKATLSVLTALMPEPASYGRILRDQESSDVLGIVEAKDASANELLLNEINSGVYIVDSAFLPGALEQLQTDNAQGELYLTDIVKRAADEGQTICSLIAPQHSEILGVNTFNDLHQVNTVQQARIRECHALSGVTFLSPETTIISPDAKLGTGVVIGPSTIIGKNVVIGENVTIEGLSYIQSAEIKSGTTLKWGLRIESSSIDKDCMIGPFAHLRPGTELGEEVKIGNFVETKKVKLADGAKASHLTYLGDATVGKNANIGAGTITCNYDGYSKFETHIEEGAFIGSNTALVAPVTVGKGATVGAGSAISKDVAPNALALTRADQRSIKEWSKKKREQENKKKK